MSRRDGTEPELPTTSFAILGLLTFGEMSGYDLMKLVQKSVGHFWSPAKSQIYAELRRLVSVGYATEREVEQDQRPDKRLYRISAAGDRALRRWIEDTTPEPETIKSPGLLKLFFGHLTTPDKLIALLEEWRAENLRILAEFRELERQIAGHEELFFPYLTLKNGLAHVRATLRWEEEALRALRERAEAGSAAGNRREEEG